jgi:phenylalanyl-tRNA synthetase beta chain
VGPDLIGPLVAARIEEIAPHPNADKLQIAQVRIKEDEPLRQIVCGAKNIEVGQIVPASLPGAQVINRTNGEALKIKVGKIRDVESCGMLCSPSELGLPIESDGIYILPSNITVGTDLIEYLGLRKKAVLHVESRSNRGDALSIVGIARETAAAMNLPLKKLLTLSSESFVNLPKSGKLSGKVGDKEICSDLGFVKIEGVNISQSPDWIKERLELAGISSKNIIVDVTNYVMIEIGQPMHAYDLNKLRQSENLTLEVSNCGEDLTKKHKHFSALNGESYELESEHLVIHDGEKVLSFAGLMGGNETAISEKTVDILIEAGCFAYWKVRATGRSTGLSSESSKRFERSVDPQLVKVALLRAIELITQFTEGKVTDSSIIESSFSKPKIEMRLSFFEQNYGSAISMDEALGILNKLGFEIIKYQEDSLEIAVPSYRARDVQRPIDLVEELARIKGLNNITSRSLPGVKSFVNEVADLSGLRETLTKKGYFENISSSLISSGTLTISNLLKDRNWSFIEMNNPLSTEHSKLRMSLLDGLVKSLLTNTRRQNNSVRLFESGKVYGYMRELSIGDQKDTGLQDSEILQLGILLYDKEKSKDWNGTSRSNGDFYELKGIIEELFEGKEKISFKALNDVEYLHPGQTAGIYQRGKLIGILGKLHPLFVKKRDLPDGIYFAELLLQPVVSESKIKVKKLSDEPFTIKDLTFDLPKTSELTHEMIESHIRSKKAKDLSDFSLISRYEGKSSDQLSLTYRLTFQSSDGTLTNEAINEEIKKLRNSLKENFSELSYRE